MSVAYTDWGQQAHHATGSDERHRPALRTGSRCSRRLGKDTGNRRSSARSGQQILPARSPVQTPKQAGLRPLSRSAIMRLRSAARRARAISRRRDANHSTCCSFIRSQGGLPITASNPPWIPLLSHSDHTPGKSHLPIEEAFVVENLPRLVKQSGKPLTALYSRQDPNLA